MIGIEDFLFGFVIGGIASVIYEIVFKKRHVLKKKSDKIVARQNLDFFLVLFLLGAIFFGSFYLLKLNTLVASVLGHSVPILVMWFSKKDLIKQSVSSGILLLIPSFFVYTIVEFLSQGWVSSFWKEAKLTNTKKS